MAQPIALLVKKYFNNNLKALAKIIKLSEQNKFTYYYEIERYLNRERNQVSTILSKLEKDNLIAIYLANKKISQKHSSEIMENFGKCTRESIIHLCSLLKIKKVL